MSSKHLPRLAEAAAGPKDVVLVLVSAPVLVGSRSAASAVLGEGGGGIDTTSEEQEGGPKNSSATLPRALLEETSTFIIEGLDHFPETDMGYPFPSTLIPKLYVKSFPSSDRMKAICSLDVICANRFSGRIFSQVSWIREGVSSRPITDDL